MGSKKLNVSWIGNGVQVLWVRIVHSIFIPRVHEPTVMLRIGDTSVEY